MHEIRGSSVQARTGALRYSRWRRAACKATRLQAAALAASSLSALCLACSAASAGPYVGQFELKDLEAEAGSVQFQSQNAYSWGQPGREMARGDDGDTLFDPNSVTRQRHAIEMELGFSRYVKTRIGIEFEKERLEEPASIAGANSYDALTLSEIGGEMIVVLVPRAGDGIGLGTVVEVEHPFELAEQNNIVLGAIIEWASGPWAATLQPMAVNFFGGDPEPGERKDNKWDFAYAAKLAYTFSDTWTLALEAYGTVDRVLGTGHLSEEDVIFGAHDQHRAGPILYYSRKLDEFAASHSGSAAETGEDKEDEVPVLSIGAGVLAGLNENTPDATLKLSIEVDY